MPVCAPLQITSAERVHLMLLYCVIIRHTTDFDAFLSFKSEFYPTVLRIFISLTQKILD